MHRVRISRPCLVARMTSTVRRNGAADLMADYIAERRLPPYAPAFRLDRYQDPAYRTLVAEWGDSGQL